MGLESIKIRPAYLHTWNITSIEISSTSTRDIQVVPVVEGNSVATVYTSINIIAVNSSLQERLNHHILNKIVIK